MKAVILAGGFGTRLSEETGVRPKPMVEIGGKPILWHIMNIYSAYGINEFIIAVGYKAEIIKEYFSNFYSINNNITVDLSTGHTSYSRWESTCMESTYHRYWNKYSNRRSSQNTS